jgi:hypothetical protein
MNPLVERFKRSLQKRVEVAPGRVIVVRRPLPGDFVEMADAGKHGMLDLIYEFTDSWEGFTDLDLFPGGDSTPTPFDKELFKWWVKDHQEYWHMLSKEIDELIPENEKRVSEAEKK